MKNQILLFVLSETDFYNWYMDHVGNRQRHRAQDERLLNTESDQDFGIL